MIKLKLVLGIIMLFLSSPANSKVLHTYSGWLTGESYYIYQDTDSELVLNYGGDEPNSVAQCKDKQEYFCFFTRRLAFVFPSNLSSDTKSWTVKGITFELLEANKIVRYLGKEFTGVFLVKTPFSATLAGRQHKENTYWLYSKVHGLLGFGYTVDGGVYWLEQEKGLGAIESRSKKQLKQPTQS